MIQEGNAPSPFSLVLELLKQENISETTVNLWFGGLSIAYIDEHYVVLTEKVEYKCNIIRRRYRELLEEKFAEVLGFPVTVYVFSEELGGMPENFKTLSPDSNGRPEAEKEAEEAHDEPSFYSTSPENKMPPMTNFYNKAYTFDNFIVGNSNKFAYAASIAVAESPTAYNPLFIYGHSGLGKTHLLYAITNKIIELHPDLNIVYVKSEEFVNQLIDAFTKKDAPSFREKYRKADILLIDDIQFIAGKEALQEEFFHTFNALYDANKQIILTSDRPPRDIKTLEDRLRTRFEWGLIVDVQPPDFELRIAILKAKAKAMGFEISNEVLTFLADMLQDNVRLIEGVIKKMGAKSFLSGVPITVDTAREAVAELVTGAEPVHITIEKILAAVSQKYSIPIDSIKGRSRNTPIMRARHIAIYLIKRLTDIPLTNIAKVFERDHSTIISSISKIEDEVAENPGLELEINELIKEIK